MGRSSPSSFSGATHDLVCLDGCFPRALYAARLRRAGADVWATYSKQFWAALDRILPFLPEPYRRIVGVGIPTLVIILVLIRLGRWALRGEDAPSPQPAPITNQNQTVTVNLPPPVAPSLPAPPKLSVDEKTVEEQLLAGVITEGAARLLLERLAKRAAEAGEAPVGAEAGKAFVKAAVEIGQEGDSAEREALALLAEGKTVEAERRLESDIQQAAGQAIEKLRRKGALFAPTDTFVAKDAYERLLALAPGDLDARNELGHLLKRLGDLAGAQAAYQAVLDAAEGDKQAEAAALGNLGLIARRLGDLAAAQDFMERSLAISDELGLNEVSANQLGNLGLVAQTRGDLVAAEDYFQRVLVLFGDLGSREGMAGTLGNLGVVAQAREDIATAEDYFRRALKLFEELGRKEGIANQLGNLGLVAHTRGDFGRAEDFHTRSLAIETELGRKEGMAQDLSNLAAVAKARGDRAVACELWGHAHSLYAEMGHRNAALVEGWMKAAGCA